jgi:hypothetical protein
MPPSGGPAGVNTPLGAAMSRTTTGGCCPIAAQIARNSEICASTWAAIAATRSRRRSSAIRAPTTAWLPRANTWANESGMASPAGEKPTRQGPTVFRPTGAGISAADRPATPGGGWLTADGSAAGWLTADRSAADPADPTDPAGAAGASGAGGSGAAAPALGASRRSVGVPPDPVGSGSAGRALTAAMGPPHRCAHA